MREETKKRRSFVKIIQEKRRYHCVLSIEIQLHMGPIHYCNKYDIYFRLRKCHLECDFELQDGNNLYLFTTQAGELTYIFYRYSSDLHLQSNSTFRFMLVSKKVLIIL